MINFFYIFLSHRMKFMNVIVSLAIMAAVAYAAEEAEVVPEIPVDGWE